MMSMEGIPGKKNLQESLTDKSFIFPHLQDIINEFFPNEHY